MKAGRELDALVAEKVMGIAVKKIKIVSHRGVVDDIGTVSAPYKMKDGREGVSAKSIPSYSTDIAAAFPLFHLLPTGYCMRWMKPGWIIEEPGPDYHLLTIAEAETAPFAICLAILKKKGVMIDPYNESDTLPYDFLGS